jgi:nucleoside 2-deoxyribosyltransferase
MRVYIAGPEVFLPDAEAVGAAKKALCRDHGLEGLWPPDCGADVGDPRALFHALVGMMDRADAGIACCTPWRGSGMDPGTAFEIGYLHAQAKPVLGYTNDARDLDARVEADGLVVEAFGFADNLMVVGPSLVSGREVVRIDAAASERWTDLRGFAACVRALAELA